MSAERAEDDAGDDYRVPDVFTFKMKRDTISVHTECEKRLADAQAEVARLTQNLAAADRGNKLIMDQLNAMGERAEQAEQRAAALAAELDAMRAAHPEADCYATYPTLRARVAALEGALVEIKERTGWTHPLTPRAAPRPNHAACACGGAMIGATHSRDACSTGSPA